ncbi:MAG: hypothetical protein RIC19_07885 [Phaeodactylibacter sp.]|uniref:hypothetical protein n=1 Tax=Phaeodactylibacter sp. TaxID=1940289 RepID=UPI0032EAE1A5
MKHSIFFLSLLLLPFVLQSAQLPSGFLKQQMAAGLDPTTITIAPDGRVLFHHLPPVSNHTLTVAVLPSGLCVLQLQYEGGQKSLKLLVK